MGIPLRRGGGAGRGSAPISSAYMGLASVARWREKALDWQNFPSDETIRLPHKPVELLEENGPSRHATPVSGRENRAYPWCAGPGLTALRLDRGPARSRICPSVRPGPMRPSSSAHPSRTIIRPQEPKDRRAHRIWIGEAGFSLSPQARGRRDDRPRGMPGNSTPYLACQRFPQAMLRPRPQGWHGHWTGGRRKKDRAPSRLFSFPAPKPWESGRSIRRQTVGKRPSGQGKKGPTSSIIARGGAE